MLSNRNDLEWLFCGHIVVRKRPVVQGSTAICSIACASPTLQPDKTSSKSQWEVFKARQCSMQRSPACWHLAEQLISLAASRSPLSSGVTMTARQCNATLGQCVQHCRDCHQGKLLQITPFPAPEGGASKEESSYYCPGEEIIKLYHHV